MKKANDFTWLRQMTFEAFKPRKEMAIDEWVDAGNLMLPSNTAEPGVLSLDRAPYQREILQSFSPDNPAQIIHLVFGAQMGKTTVEIATMAYYIAMCPSPMAFAFSDEDNLKGFIKKKFDPLIAANPSIKEQIKSDGSSRADTLTNKIFPGGFLKFLSGKSEGSMRSDSTRIIMADEVDAMGVTKGGDVLTLLLRRTTTFGDSKKIGMSSTPLNDSVMWGYLESSTFKKYFMKCPHCKQEMTFELEYLKWHAENGQVLSAWMECPHCKGMIQNHEKLEMMKAENGAHWVATNPNAPITTQGYYLPTFYAPVGWTSWKDIANEYYQACMTEKGEDYDKLTAFMNTIIAKPYTPGMNTQEWRQKFDECQKSCYMRGEVPEWVIFITTATDVQGDRLETEAFGWGYMGRHISIDRYIFRLDDGESIDTQNNSAWETYRAEIIKAKWTREDGLEMSSLANCCDSSWKEDIVYSFYQSLDGNEKEKFYPIKGDEKLTGTTPVSRTVHKENFSGVKFYRVPVNVLKHQIFANLKEMDDSETRPFLGFYPCDYDEEYYKQLYSENFTKVGNKTLWKKNRDRNETLDLHVYNYAMFYLQGLGMFTDSDWQELAEAQKETLKRSNVNKTILKGRTRRRVTHSL